MFTSFHKSSHAEMRSKQRGISDEVLQVILNFGTIERRPGNAVLIHIEQTRREELLHELKSIMKCVEKAKSKSVIASEDGAIITAYHRVKRLKNK